MICVTIAIMVARTLFPIESLDAFIDANQSDLLNSEEIVQQEFSLGELVDEKYSAETVGDEYDHSIQKLVKRREFEKYITDRIEI